MAVTMKQVRGFLEAEEPKYNGVAALGPEALPHLKKLVNGADTMLASKAAYAASLFADEEGADVLVDAANHANPVVRVAVAAALRNMPSTMNGDFMQSLFDDDDAGVRGAAVKSAGKQPSKSLRRKISEMASNDSDPAVREISRSILGRLAESTSETGGEPRSERDEDGMGGGFIDDESHPISKPKSRGTSPNHTEELDGQGGGDFGTDSSSMDSLDGMGGGELPNFTSVDSTLSPFGGGSF